MQSKSYALMCIISLHLYASDSESGFMARHSPQRPAVLVGTSAGSSTPHRDEVRLDMDQFENSLAMQTPSTFVTKPLTTNLTVARLVTQIGGETSAYLMPSLLAELNKMETEDPDLHQHTLSVLTEHRTRAIRRTNLIRSQGSSTEPDPVALTTALQNEVPAAAVQLITKAAAAVDTQKTALITEQAMTITQQKAKFWTNLTITGLAAIAATIGTLAASAVAIIQALNA